MSLLTYKDVRPWARAIRTKVLDRTMPPWFADSAHGTFTNDRSLPAADLETVRRWVDDGAVEGDPSHAQGWQIKPEHIVTLPERRVPARGVIEWESVAVPFPVQRERSEPDRLHHHPAAARPKVRRDLARPRENAGHPSLRGELRRASIRDDHQP